MRSIGVGAIMLASSLAALAQSTPRGLGEAQAGQPARPPAAAAQAAAEAALSAKPAKKVAIPPARATYEAMSNAERVAIQSDLIWSGDYNGIANGEFTDRALDAVKAFQKTNGGKETAVLNPQERVQLAELSKSRQASAGWKIVDDPRTGAKLGVPTKIVPQLTTDSNLGTRWQSAHGEAQVEVFRVNAPGTTLAAVYEQQRKVPASRRVEYNVLKPDFFVISGLQGLKKFYVRAHILGGEVRGMTVLYDQAMEGTMDPIVIAMSSAFVPFPAGAAPAHGKVDYGSGILVSAAGHIITDRAVVEDCNVITVPGFGNAEHAGDDRESALALLRLNGVRKISPVAVGGDVARGGDVILVGIADPQAQDGGSAVTTAKAKLAGSTGSAGGTARALDPAPAAGFSGAAAIDGDAHFVGMVLLKPRSAAATAPATAAVAATAAATTTTAAAATTTTAAATTATAAAATTAATAGTAAVPAALVDAVTVRRFLDAQKVETVAGSTSVEQAKAAIVRVICVRK